MTVLIKDLNAQAFISNVIDNNHFGHFSGYEELNAIHRYISNKQLNTVMDSSQLSQDWSTVDMDFIREKFNIKIDKDSVKDIYTQVLEYMRVFHHLAHVKKFDGKWWFTYKS